MIKNVLILGALPLMLCSEILQEVVVQEDTDSAQNIKEESFYRSYSQDTVTKEQIKQEGARDIKSALSNIPGVQVKETGSFSKTLTIRGLSGERVVSVVDGMKLANQGITHTGGGELGLVDLSTVEKIELIKGSPAVIFDPGATGGVVKVSTIKDISKMQDGVGGKYTYGYDDGYFMNTHSLLLEGKYKDIYASLTGTKIDSKDRNVEDRDKVDRLLGKTNLDQERTGEFELTDLGFDSEAYQFFTSYQFNDKASIYFKKSDYQANDISFTHGGQDATVFHYDEYSRESTSIGISTKDILGLDKIDFNYNSQDITRMIQASILAQNIVTVNSETYKIDATKNIDAYEFQFGLEVTKDEAKTLTLSNQTYAAGYLNAGYTHEDFTLTMGARYNHYKVEQLIEEGRNLDVIYDLVGVSGVLKDPIKEDGWSYALGLTYLINDNNNLSANYSKTYRYPTLYERFAYDVFLGGGADMEAEEADSYEMSYKYLDESFSANLTFFYTDFSTFNSVYRFISINNLDYLVECNSDPECNPFDGGVNEREIFTTFLKHATFSNVTNKGFELALTKTFEDQNIELGFNTSINDFTDAVVPLENSVEPLVIVFDQDPLEFSAYVKKEFNVFLKPWVKLKIRHVTNKPTVEQTDGFESFTLANLYFGLEYENFVLNAGIQNLTNAVYHEPYMGLDGVKRTFHMNLSASF